MHRKVVAAAFWNSEVEEELRELGWIDFRFQKAGNHAEVLDKIDRQRSMTVYSSNHSCSEECKKEVNYNSYAYIP